MSSVPGPLSSSASKRRAFSSSADAFSPIDTLVPGGDRIGLVEPQDVPELGPEALVGFVGAKPGEDHLRPVGMRAGNDAPVRGAVVDHSHRLLDPGQEIPPETGAVEAVESVGGNDPGEAHPGAAALRRVEQPLTEPRRDVLERVVGRALDPGALHPRVVVVDVDELRASAVGGSRHRPRELFLPDGCGHEQDLTRLDVGAMNPQLCHCLEALVHGRRSYSQREP